MDVSILIVNYHSAELIVDCCNSIRDKTKDLEYEIIVVDNASNDNSIEVLKKKLGTKIHLVVSDENLGFGKANNLAAEYAHGKYLFILNPDTVLVNNAIKILYDYMEENVDVGISGGNLYSLSMTATPSYCMHFDDLMTEKKAASWYKIIRKKIGEKTRTLSHKTYQPFVEVFNYSNEIKEVAYIFGADMMVSKKLFEEVQGFDPDFFMYAEEEELSWRITQKGYRIVSIPQAQIIHLEGATINLTHEFNIRQFKMRMTGTMTYYKKRFGMDGVNLFYQYRSKRYQRLVKIAKLQNKYSDDLVPALQNKYLEEVYKEFMRDQN